MAAILIRRGVNFTSARREWVSESLEDMNAISEDDISYGDSVYIFDGDNKGEIYFANSSKEWILQ